MSQVSQKSDRMLTLAIPRPSAEAQLGEELQKWRRLRAAPASTMNDIGLLDDTRQKARKFTQEVLLRMFTTDRGANQVGTLVGRMRSGLDSVGSLLNDH